MGDGFLGMSWGMGFGGILILVIAVLTILALIKYLRS